VGQHDLARSLRESGHEDLAQRLEEKELADRLRRADRADLADALEGGQSGQPIQTDTASEGEAFLQELRDKLNSGWTSVEW
jgi:hypothetical protein